MQRWMTTSQDFNQPWMIFIYLRIKELELTPSSHGISIVLAGSSVIGQETIDVETDSPKLQVPS